MGEQLTINFENQTISARELHKALNIELRFSAWFENNSQGFVEGEDFTTVSVNTEVNNNGGVQIRQLIDHNVSLDMAKHICLMSRTEKGKQCRQYLIDLEKAWNTPEQIMARALKMADAAIKELQGKNQALIADNERMKPKEVFADAVSASENSILVRELAKMLRQNGADYGEKRLYKQLRKDGFICQNSTEPTQRAMEMGLFERIVRTVQRGSDLPLETTTTKVTGKGQCYFINRYLGREISYA